jgi:drug/metabolite transporter (DMT)-like permease
MAVNDERQSSSAHSRALLRAVAWMMGALISFLTMGVAGRALSAELPIFEIVMLRNLICLIVISALIARLGKHLLRPTNLKRHLARNTVHFAAQCGWYFGLATIPFVEVFAIEFTVPVWTAILAALFLEERLSVTRVMAICLGLVGIVVILRPGLVEPSPGTFAVLAAAVGFAIMFVITKNIVNVDRPITILFWMNLIQLPIGIVLSIPVWVNPTLDMAPWIALVGAAGIGSHYCLSRAMALADATIVVTLDFIRLPLAAVLGWFLYAEPLSFFVLLGAMIILLGNWLNVRKT